MLLRSWLLGVLLAMFAHLLPAMKYPNEIDDAPLVLCEPKQIVVKVKTTASNPSHIYAEDFADDPECSARNKNSIEIKHGKCGMSTERTEDPMGAVQRVCLSVQLHPLFVTEADRAYCVQCVYVEQHVLSDFEQSIAVSEATATELEPQFDFSTVPKCTYSIRKGSSNGPPAHYAAIGESVFHVWSCEGTSLGILVQNCYVEDGQGNRILIVDQNGCGVDHYVMDTPEYNEDLTSAFQETHVFKFAQRTVTRFACQIRICMQGEDCHAISPPRSCPSIEERMAEVKRLADQPALLKPIYQTMDAATRKTEEAADEKAKEEMLAEHGPNATIGSVYFGSDANRARREVTALPPPSLKKNPKGYPEMDVVGEIRVLESEEDVQYFERHQSVGVASTGLAEGCISGLSYSLLLCSLVVLCLLLLSLLLLFALRSTNSHKSRSMHFPQ